MLRAKGVPGQSVESWSSGFQSRAGQARSLHFSLSVPLSACGDLDTFWEASRGCGTCLLWQLQGSCLASLVSRGVATMGSGLETQGLGAWENGMQPTL